MHKLKLVDKDKIVTKTSGQQRNIFLGIQSPLFLCYKNIKVFRPWKLRYVKVFFSKRETINLKKQQMFPTHIVF